MKRAVLAIVAVLALAGCGAEQQSSVDQFSGAERDVAQKVEDLQDAGENRNPEDICSEILAAKLVDELEAAGTSCADEMEKAIDDADDFDLEVREVSVTGETATARVQRGDDGPTATFEFARENGQWRATSLGSA
jgi:outer membrane murein-binding lipoprotein Lpp